MSPWPLRLNIHVRRRPTRAARDPRERLRPDKGATGLAPKRVLQTAARRERILAHRPARPPGRSTELRVIADAFE